MTTYTKATNFATKDALLTGNPSKVVKGTEIDAEFTAIQAADATSLKSGGALGTPSSGTLTNCTGLPPAGVTGTAAILGANTFTGLQTLNGGMVLETGGVRGEVTMVRTGAATWSITDEKGVAINTAGTTTAGLQEAINYATTNGFNLRAIGGGTSRSADYGIMNCTTGVSFPALRDMSVFLDGVHIVFSAAVTGTGLLFDSCMQLDFRLVGEVTYQGTGAAIKIKPTNAIPVDTNTVCTGSRFYIGGIASTGGTPDAMLHMDVSVGSIIGNRFEVSEIVGSGAVGSPAVAAYGLKISGQTSSTAWYSNILDIANIHDCTSACVQEGVVGTDQNQIACNIYRIGQLTPKGANAQGWNGYGQSSQIQVGNIAPVSGSTMNYGVYLQSGSTKNIFTIGLITGAGTASVTDLGTLNNFIYSGISLIPVETKTAFTFAGTWADLGAGQPPCKYWTDPFGYVHLEGACTGGSADTITTLPAGYRPAAVYLFDTNAGGALARVQIDTSGVVTSTSHTSLNLNGIYFRP